MFTYCCRCEFGLLILITIGRKKRRIKISTRNQINTEEIREKNRERKRKKRAILRGKEVTNQPMMGESNAIANNIGILRVICNFIFRYIISFSE